MSLLSSVLAVLASRIALLQLCDTLTFHMGYDRSKKAASGSRCAHHDIGQPSVPDVCIQGLEPFSEQRKAQAKHIRFSDKVLLHMTVMY